MSSGPSFSQLPENFDGVVRMFPLPNLVLFPGVVQPLHLFESRYCELFEDAIASDELITTALLRPGWERDYVTRPPVWPAMCVGRILSHSKDDQGHYNLLLLGLSRATMVKELPPSRSFRQALVTPQESTYPPSGDASRAGLQRQLVDLFRSLVVKKPEAGTQIDQLLTGDLPLAALTDIIAFTLSIDVEQKYQLLAEPDVDIRAARMAELLEQDAAGKRRPFPPPFSDN